MGRALGQVHSGRREALAHYLVGGLAANVGLVLMLGLGLLVAHQLHKWKFHGAGVSPLGLVVVVAFLPAVIVIVVTTFYHLFQEGNLARRIFFWIYVAVTGLIWLVGLFGVIGYAEGVK